ncbi:MAG: hypothetical protein LBN28_05620, partial [Desulfovibrio sp.]|nr:hypothetical protein [Desulfovibrio sp.]
MSRFRIKKYIGYLFILCLFIGFGGRTTVNATNGSTASPYSNQVININGDLYGGGTIDASNENLGDINGKTFNNNTITVSGSLNGGGIVGASYSHTIGDIINCSFTNNVITASKIAGGGILGASSGDLFSNINVGLGSFGNISNSQFTGNTITANATTSYYYDEFGHLYQTGSAIIRGGIVYSANDLTISDSQFTNNNITSTNGIVYGGAVTMDTAIFIDRSAAGNADANTSRLTIIASPGHETIFQNNKVKDESGERYNSITFQSVRKDYNPLSKTNAILDIKAAGTVSLYDPIYVRQTND